MALILNIDTATETAVISISEDDKIINFITNSTQKDHASFLHPAIKNLLQQADIPINKLKAVSVTSGPGSYTGLRVGMACAKGLCYSLNIPLIAVDTLQVMSLSSIKQVADDLALYCPMIDARRMEVFTAVYDNKLTEIMKPASMILEESSFKELLKNNKIYFSGSGILKLKNILINDNAFYINKEIAPDPLAILAFKKYIKNNFSDIAYTSPVYLKEFYTIPKQA